MQQRGLPPSHLLPESCDHDPNTNDNLGHHIQDMFTGTCPSSQARHLCGTTVCLGGLIRCAQ